MKTSSKIQFLVRLDLGDGSFVERSFPTSERADDFAKALAPDGTPGRLTRTQPTAHQLRALDTLRFETCAAEFLDACREGRKGRAILAPNTLRHYEHKLGLANRRVGRANCHDMKKKDLVDLFDRLVDDGYSRTTARHVVATVRNMFRWLDEQDLIDRNPFGDFRIRRTARDYDPTVPLCDIYTDGEVADILAEMRKPSFAATRDWTIAVLGFFAGLRIGETLGLEWRHVDLAERRIHIVQNAHDRTGAIQPTKTPRARRTIPMVDRVHRALSDWRRTAHATNGRVFLSSTERPLIQRNVLRSLQIAQRSLGYPDLHTFHQCRHYFASKLIAGGIDIYSVSKLIGHADPAFTIRVYAHSLDAVTFERRDGAFAKRVDAALFDSRI